MTDYAGKNVLITGASSGIGAGLAEEFAKRGARVGICARRTDRLQEVLERCQAHSPESVMWTVDLSVADEVRRLADEATATLGPIHVLVNNAGIPKRRHVTKLDMDTVEAVMGINFFSPIQLTMAILPQMLERGSGQIVNVSSVAATLSSPGEAAYDASKAAVTAFSECMAIDLHGRGIGILIVYPGLVDTELFSLPDNDPVVDAVEPIPVAELVADVFGALNRGDLQVYSPPFFGELAAGKASNVQGFIDGAAAFLASKQTPDEFAAGLS